MRTLAVVSAGILLSGVLLSAQNQIHPCDAQTPETQTIQSGAPHALLFCALAADAVEAAAVYVDDNPFDLVSITAISGPSPTGFVLYETAQIIQVGRGTHAIEVAPYNRSKFSQQLQLGAKSLPFSFAADDERPVPQAPAVKGVIR